MMFLYQGISDNEEIIMEFDNENLYRIISFESLVSLCLTKQERFANPILCWDDTYEGYALYRLASKKGNEEAIQYLYNKFDGAADKILDWISRMHYARFACFGQCWSKNADSDAMWRIYSYDNKAIQIISNKERIINSIISNMELKHEYRIDNVKYDIKSDDLLRILDDMKITEMIQEPFFHKREAFEHENEIRIIITLLEPHIGLLDFTYRAMCIAFFHDKSNDNEIAKLNRAVEAGLSKDYKGFYGIGYNNEIFLGVRSLADYIQGVRVHPLANERYVLLVKRLCEEYGLSFLGKSDLYSDPIAK